MNTKKTTVSRKTRKRTAGPKPPTPPDEFVAMIESAFPGGFSVRDEANALVAIAFRNGPLEDLHAGKPSELLEDPSLSRITDDEIRKLMIHSCDVLENLLRIKENDPERYYQYVKVQAMMFCRDWER